MHCYVQLQAAQPLADYVQSTTTPSLLHPTFRLESLASKDRGAGYGVVCEVIVDVGSVTWLVALDVAWDLDGWGWGFAAASGNCELRALGVELRDTAGVVDGKLLGSE